MILFFIRRYNDIDHIAPVIYKISSSTNEKLIVLCLNPSLPIKEDYRLRFLRKNYGVKIDYLYNFFTINITQKIIGMLLINKNINNTFMKMFGNIFKGASKIIRGITGVRGIVHELRVKPAGESVFIKLTPVIKGINPR